MSRCRDRAEEFGVRPPDSQGAMKTLNIGLVGYGFMGRTHSNAFLQAPRFFDLPCKPVLKAVAARNEERVKKFAANWGYESYDDRLARARRAQGHRRHRHRQPERHASRDRHCRGEGRQDGDVREAARAHRAGSAGDGRRGRKGRRAEHRLVQLPPRPRGHDDQAAARRGEARAHLPLPREVPAGLDDLAGPAAGRRRAVASRRRRSPAAASPATCSRTTSTPRCG